MLWKIRGHARIVSLDSRRRPSLPSSFYLYCVRLLSTVHFSYLMFDTIHYITTLIFMHIQGKVHNPSGAGVRATSTQVQAKALKKLQQQQDAVNVTEISIPSMPTKNSETSHGGANTAGGANNSNGAASDYATDGSSRRNITRKKTADQVHRYDSTHKKQGGHGKGQWMTADLADTAKTMTVDQANQLLWSEPLHEKDPLYMASEDSPHYILTSAGGNTATTTTRGRDPSTQKQVYGPLLTLSEFKVQVADCLKEYLMDSCDADEVVRRLQELSCKEYHAQVVVKKAVSLALDLGPREREWTSRLLTALHPTPLSLEDMEEGFNVLLDGMEDLAKDVPDAVVR
jgi:hypothetical protein